MSTATTTTTAVPSSNDFYSARTLKHIARQVHQFMRKYGDRQQQQLHQQQHQQQQEKTNHHQHHTTTTTNTTTSSCSSSSTNDMWLLPSSSDSLMLHEVHAVLSGPCGTPYEGGVFHVRLHFPPDYPQQPPRGTFLTRLFHPNVSPQTGDICVDTLKRDWDPATTLERILLVVRCLLIEPNPDSALNAEAGRLIQEDFQQFAQRARMFTRIYAAQDTRHNNDNNNSSSSSDNNKENRHGSTEGNTHQCAQTQAAPSTQHTPRVLPQGKGIKASAKVTAAARKKTSLKRL